jgi:HK97 family phage prohead protease
MSFVASTDRADRYGDIINQQGWDLDAYRSNPVVLLNHDHGSLPIGKGTVRIGEQGLIIDVDFDMEDPRAAEIAGKAKRGFLNAVLVGFSPLKSTPRSDLPVTHYAHSKSGGNYFDRAELLEVSVVTIPANADVVVIAAKQLGALDLRSMITDIVKGEIAAMPIPSFSKHILDIMEDDETVTIVFAKPHAMPQEEEAMQDEEDMQEESAHNMDEQDDEEKALLKALLTINEGRQ